MNKLNGGSSEGEKSFFKSFEGCEARYNSSAHNVEARAPGVS